MRKIGEILIIWVWASARPIPKTKIRNTIILCICVFITLFYLSYNVTAQTLNNQLPTFNDTKEVSTLSTYQNSALSLSNKYVHVPKFCDLDSCYQVDEYVDSNGLSRAPSERLALPCA